MKTFTIHCGDEIHRIGLDEEHKDLVLLNHDLEAEEIARLLGDETEEESECEQVYRDSFNTLMWAVDEGHIEMVRFLLAEDWVGQRECAEGLMFAANNEDRNMLELLLAQAPAVWTKRTITNRRWEKEFNTALAVAASHGFFEGVDLLLAYGADLRHGNDRPLDNAARANQVEMVKYLLDLGAQVPVYGKTQSQR